MPNSSEGTCPSNGSSRVYPVQSTWFFLPIFWPVSISQQPPKRPEAGRLLDKTLGRENVIASPVSHIFANVPFRLEEEMKECTFNPSVSRKSEQLLEEKSRDSANSSRNSSFDKTTPEKPRQASVADPCPAQRHFHPRSFLFFFVDPRLIVIPGHITHVLPYI